jgi:hypothetical protein
VPQVRFLNLDLGVAVCRRRLILPAGGSTFTVFAKGRFSAFYSVASVLSRRNRNTRKSSPITTHAEHKLSNFYEGTGPDHRGRHLAAIWDWSDDELERVHDYIQWLFPLREKSGFNPDAPLLDDATAQEFRERPELQANLRRSFLRMLKFYGLESRGADPPAIHPSKSFPSRSTNWLTPSNHNHLRITRILKSLRELGLDPEAQAFFACLTTLYEQEQQKHLPAISPDTFHYWRSATRS